MAEDRCERGEPPSKVRCDGERPEREVAADVHGININRLPDEILINIFSSLGFNELIDNVQNVCLRWRRLAHDPKLWLDKEYIVRGRSSILQGRSCCGVICSKCIHGRCESTDEEVLRTAEMVPQLRKLTLMRKIKVDIFRKICTNWPNLTCLHVDFRQEMNYSLMKHIFEKCPRIEKLKLWTTMLIDQRCMELLSSLEHLSTLEVLLDKPHLTPVRLRLLTDACPRLKEIHIDWNYFAPQDFEYFLKANKHTLTSATLLWTVGEAQKTSVVPLLKQCSTSLRKLRLVYFDTPRAMETVAFEALGELHSLHELSMQYLSTYEPKLISRAFRPGCLTQLRRLLMQYTTDLLDETVIAISQGCPNLRELRICASYKITDVALSEIHCLRHLEILELSRCSGLSGTAMAYISQLPTLHTLILQFTEDLAKLQPSLRLIVELKELRCLDILKSGNIKAVPFGEFPNRLLKLRELRVTYESENDFTELQRKMPNLKISNTAWLTEDDFPKDDDADYGYRDG
ncbi:uncharacterized protein LOC126215057 isoform X1 [Schistocerca nitens]|uniref:uncharacterized protein LOC126215057 isoform X1 n=2 Tax=Schistocerca nitens TaxID=7011 RepID=UPI002117B3DE|nr:uncharacterized protein LOC126215057 isoform X1 [Schistocerca nitens]